MAAQCLTKKQLEDIIWEATALSLGLDVNRPETQNRIRVSWPDSDFGNGTWRRDENVIFLRISPDNDEIGTQHDTEVVKDSATGNIVEAVTYLRAHAISWICYGPDSFDDADAIRIGMLRDNVRAFLMRHNIGINPKITEPVNLPEPDESGLWWERHDVTAHCYEKVRREYESGEILVAPTVITQFN